MKWHIPAKTFFLGEYCALHGKGALLVTTRPLFSMTLSLNSKPTSIHPDSPAGKYWKKQQHPWFLHWEDPYLGKGGMGASSAQFIGAYLAHCYLENAPANREDMLTQFYSCAWQEVGLKPSGYDILAQSQEGFVYINREQQLNKSYHWQFSDISFLLVHTGVKLATHQHLESLPSVDTGNLAGLVDVGILAFEKLDSSALIHAVNAYQKELQQLGFSSEHTQQLIRNFRTIPGVITAKGCGALGADVILLITETKATENIVCLINEQGFQILASTNSINTQGFF